MEHPNDGSIFEVCVSVFDAFFFLCFKHAVRDSLNQTRETCSFTHFTCSHFHLGFISLFCRHTTHPPCRRAQNRTTTLNHRVAQVSRHRTAPRRTTVSAAASRFHTLLTATHSFAPPRRHVTQVSDKKLELQ